MFLRMSSVIEYRSSRGIGLPRYSRGLFQLASEHLKFTLYYDITSPQLQYRKFVAPM